MAEKRASDEPEPEPKRAATSARLFDSMVSYRTLLEYCGQTLAAQLWCAWEDHYDTIDEWVHAQSPETIGRAILKMLPQYDANRSIVEALLRAFPAVWTTPIDGEPFVWRLYATERGNAGDLESLIVELCTTEVANCADSDGNTLLYYATELMHVSVVEHLLLKLQCDVPVNKHGHHALFAPLLHGSVDFEPMQRIIRTFHYARQRRPRLFDTFLCAKGLTVLGWLATYPYPELVRTWLKCRNGMGFLTARTSIWQVKPNERIDDLLTISPEVAKIAAEIKNDNVAEKFHEAVRAKNAEYLKQLIRDGVDERQFWGLCKQIVLGQTHATTFAAHAIIMNDPELLEMSITSSGNVTQICSCTDGPSLCVYAVLKRAPAHLTILRNHGATIDTTTRSKELSPVYQMIGIPEFTTTALSLLPSIDLNAVYTSQRVGTDVCTRLPATLLHRAVFAKDRAMILALLDRGAAINGITTHSALYCAVDKGSIEIVDLLLARGAIPTPIDLLLAAQLNRADIFERLRPHVFDDPNVFERFASSPAYMPTCKFCHHTSTSHDKKLPSVPK